MNYLEIYSFRRRKTQLKDTLTFELFTPDEVLKGALTIEKIKQTLHAFQKSQVNTLTEGYLSGSQIKPKHEPIMAVINKGQTKKLPNKEQN